MEENHLLEISARLMEEMVDLVENLEVEVALMVVKVIIGMVQAT